MTRALRRHSAGCIALGLALAGPLLGCQPSPPPAPKPDAAPAEPTFARAQSTELYRSLGQPLPEGEPRLTACLARIAQATILARRERDPQAQARALAAQRECRGFLVQHWLAEADRALPHMATSNLGPTSRLAEACAPAQSHLEALRRLDAQAAGRHDAAYAQRCAPDRLAAAAAAHGAQAPRPIGAGDRVAPSCDRRDSDSTCEVVADALIKAGTAEASCTRTRGRYAAAEPCPAEARVGACALKTGTTWFAYRAGAAPFDNLRARTACEQLGGAFAHADETPPPGAPPPPGPGPGAPVP